MAEKTENWSTDELEAPEWLNKDFIGHVLSQWTKNSDIKIKNLELTPGTNRGDHYASIMFRAKVDYEQGGQQRVESMIIKTTPDYEGHKQDLIKEIDAFAIEIGVYSEVLPKYEAVLKASGDEVLIGPKCIYSSSRPKTVIIFEDLVNIGYTVIRGRELTLEEVRGAYFKLAKWHAAGYKMGLEDSNFFNKYRRGIMSLSNVIKEEYVTSGIVNFIDLLEKVPTLREYKPYFESIAPNLIQRCKASFEGYSESADALFTLCHGDFHSKNMMFKHDPSSGNYEDVKLLDFQVSYKGPMVNDLIYSFFMALSAEHRLHNFDELLEYYFNTFLETLSKIGFTGQTPTIEDLKEQWKQSRDFEMFLLVTFLPIWDIFKSGEVEPTVLLQSADYRKKVCFRSVKLIRELHDLLPRYKRLGYFDL